MKDTALRFDEVSFSYGEEPVLDGASFHIHEGEFAALIGPNGAGKTTVLKLLLGLARPARGRVTVFGLPPEEARAQVGYVPQQASYDPAFPISVKEVVRMGGLDGSGRRYSPADSRAALRALEAAGLADLARRPYSALSGGQRRRVLVARALAAEPRMLVLDEPTANMDADSESRLFSVLGLLKGKTTILIVTHDTLFVSALTDSVYCVGDKRSGKSVLRHGSAPADYLSSVQYGGPALQVLHDTELPEDGCFEGEGEK